MTKEELEKEALEKYKTGSYPQIHPDHYAFIHGYLAGAEPRGKRIEALEEENAELKADNDARKFAMAMSEKVEKQLRQENEKAKEIIKKFSEFANLEVGYDLEHPQEHTDLWNELCEEAEQFLKEADE